MALVDWNGWPWAPAWLANINTTAPTFGTNVTLDADGEKIAWIFEAPKTGNLKALGFRIHAVTNTPDNGLRAAWYSIASGLPNAETHFDILTASPFTTGFKTTGIISTDGTDTGTKKAVTQGDRVCAVVTIETFTAADSLVITAHTTGVWQGTGFGRGFPYYLTDVGGAGWVKGAGAGEGVFDLAVQYDDDVWYPISCVAPIHAVNSHVLTSATNPDEIALSFTVPVPLRIQGVQFQATFAGTTSTASAKIYNSSGTALATATAVAGSDDVGGGTGTGQSVHLTFPSSVELAANIQYILGVKATGAGNVTVYSVDAVSAALMAAMPLGANFQFTSRQDTDAFAAATATRVPLIVPVFDGNDFNPPGGGNVTFRRYFD